MQIKRLSVNHFGKLDNLTVTLNGGINVISGKNESGKSTLHSFTEAMFFGMERGRGRAAKDDAYTHFTPWSGGTYGGAIEVIKDDKAYCVSRNFSRDAAAFSVRNETDSRNLPSSKEVLDDIFSGLTPPLYRNTISVGQLGVGTGSDLAGELKNHIINLQSTGAADVDVINAVASLKAERKQLMSGYKQEAKTSYEELGIRKATLEKQLEEDTSAYDLANTEAQRSDCEEKVMLYERDRDRLGTVISENEKQLRNNRIADSDDIETLSENITKLTEDVSDFRNRHKLNSGRGAKPLYIIFLILSVLILAASGYFTYLIFLRKGLADWKPYIPMAPIAVAALIFAIIFLVNLIRTNKYLKLKKEFKAYYKMLFGEEPEVVNSITVDRLAREPKKLADTITVINQAREKLTDTTGKLTLEREELSGLLSELDINRRRDWEREQKERELADLSGNIDALKETLSRNAAISKEVAAIDMAMDTMVKVSETNYDSMGSQLEESVSCILGSMTAGAYSGVQIDDNLNVSLLANGRRVDLSSVSTGTLDQVYLALRLACIELFWPEENMPLLLDDTFAMYDSDRLSRTLAWLSSFYEGQIIIFTCHTREHEILDSLGIEHNLVTMA